MADLASMENRTTADIDRLAGDRGHGWRKTAAAPISRASCGRFSSCRSAARPAAELSQAAATWPIIGVLTTPGQMAFTRMSNSATSLASACVNPITANFDAE